MGGVRLEREELKVAWKVPLDEHYSFYSFMHLAEIYQVPPLNHHSFSRSVSST